MPRSPIFNTLADKAKCNFVAHLQVSNVVSSFRLRVCIQYLNGKIQDCVSYFRSQSLKESACAFPIVPLSPHRQSFAKTVSHPHFNVDTFWAWCTFCLCNRKEQKQAETC